MAAKVEHKFLDIDGVGVLKNEFDKVISSSEQSAKEHTDTKIANLPNTYYTESEIDEKISAINTDLEDLESRSMMKSVYDTNNSGVVDNAEKVNGFTVGVNVPANAKFTDTVYTHPSYTARTGVPSANQTPAFGGSFTVTQPVSDASGHITAMNSRTVTIPSATATTSNAGLMSTADKAKLDGVQSGATKVESSSNGKVKINGTDTTVYTLPSAGSDLGGVKSGGDVTISDGVITVNDDSHNHVISNIDGLQDAINNAETNANTYTDEAIANLLENSDDAVNSIFELADAMEENADAIAALESIAAGHAEKNHTHDNYAVKTEVYSKEESDAKYLTEHPAITLDGKTNHTKTMDYGEQIEVIGAITQDDNGHITKYTNRRLTFPTVDDYFSTSSTNPVQNKVVTEALNNKASLMDVMSLYNKTTTWNDDETVYTTTWTVDGVSYQEVLTEVSDTEFTKQYYVDGVLSGTWVFTIDETNKTSSVVYTA